jgi:hypothetical protein
MGRGRHIIGGSARHGDRTDVLGKQSGVSNTGKTQRPPEGTTSLRLLEAGRFGMQVRSPARQSAVWIGRKPKVSPGSDRDEPQQ